MYVAKYPLRGVECRRPAKLAEARSAASPPSLKKGYAHRGNALRAFAEKLKEYMEKNGWN